MYKYTYNVPDYEHSGDLEWGKQYILKHFPNATNIHAYEERDYEQENEYAREYGECDEYIYNGFIDFEVPDKLTNEQLDLL